MVRCQCQKKAKQKKKKSSDLCTKGGTRGERFLKSQEAVLHSGGRKLGTRDTRQRATAGGYVCIWTLREKKWPILTVIFCFCFFFFSFFWQTTPVSAMPSPSQPHWGSGSTVKDALRAPGWWCWWRVGAFSHPWVKYQLWLCEHTHCAYLLAYAHTHCRADLNYSKLEKKKKHISLTHSKNSHWMHVFEPETRLNVVHQWKRNATCCRFRPVGVWGAFRGAASLVARSFQLDVSPDFPCCGQLY